MTITAEPPSQTLPQYRHQPLHTPDSPLTSRLSVVGTMHNRFDEILTDDALDFVCGLHGQFAGRRAELLAVRRSRGDQRLPFRFLTETVEIREDPAWRVAPLAPGLADRRCEHLGPRPGQTFGTKRSGRHRKPVGHLTALGLEQPAWNSKQLLTAIRSAVP